MGDLAPVLPREVIKKNMDGIQLLTRKGATCSDLLSCLYGLKPTELTVFFEIARRGGNATVDQISAAVDRDRTTTHRTLSKLLSTGLIYKQTRGLKDGGYYHVYSTVEVSRIKEHAELRVKDIADSLQKLIDNFEADFYRRLEAVRERMEGEEGGRGGEGTATGEGARGSGRAYYDHDRTNHDFNGDIRAQSGVQSAHGSDR